MKKFITIFTLVLSLVLLVACNPEDKNNETPVIGFYVQIVKDNSNLLPEFKAENSVHFYVTNENNISQQFSGYGLNNLKASTQVVEDTVNGKKSNIVQYKYELSLFVNSNLEGATISYYPILENEELGEAVSATISSDEVLNQTFESKQIVNNKTTKNVFTVSTKTIDKITKYELVEIAPDGYVSRRKIVTQPLNKYVTLEAVSYVEVKEYYLDQNGNEQVRVNNYNQDTKSYPLYFEGNFGIFNVTNLVIEFTPLAE